MKTPASRRPMTRFSGAYNAKTQSSQSTGASVPMSDAVNAWPVGCSELRGQYDG